MDDPRRSTSAAAPDADAGGPNRRKRKGGSASATTTTEPAATPPRPQRQRQRQRPPPRAKPKARPAAKPAAKRKGSVFYVIDASLYDDDPDALPKPSAGGAASSGADSPPGKKKKKKEPPPDAAEAGPSPSGSSAAVAFEAARRAVVHGVVGRMSQVGGGGAEVIVCRSDQTTAPTIALKKGWWKESLTGLVAPEIPGGSAAARKEQNEALVELLKGVRRVSPSRSKHPASEHRGGTVLQGLCWAAERLRERREWADPTSPANGSRNEEASDARDRIVVLLDGTQSRLAWPQPPDKRCPIHPDMRAMIGHLRRMGCTVRFVYMNLKGVRDAEMQVRENGSAKVDPSSSDCETMDVEVEGVASGAGEGVKGEEESDDDDDDDVVVVDDSDDDDGVDDSDDGEWNEWILHDDRKLMLSGIAQQIQGGSDLVVAESLQQVLDATAPPPDGVASAKRDNVDIVVTSDLVIQATQSAMVVKKGMPTVRSDRVKLEDKEGKIVDDAESGEPMLSDRVYTEKIRHVDGEVIDPDDVVRVVSFCRDRIPMSAADYLYVHRNDDAQLLDNPRYELLGFMDALLIPQALLSGPPKVLSGKGSDQPMVAALAQTLEAQGAVAVCTVTSKLSESARNSGRYPPQILGALYPLVPSQVGGQAENSPLKTALAGAKAPTQLVFLQLPFKGEVKDVAVPSTTFDGSRLGPSLGGLQAQACDAMIDAMRLRPGEFELESVASPALRSWEQTVVQRFLNPYTNEITSCVLPDPILSNRPADEAKVAKEALDNFWKTHSLPCIDVKRKAESQQATKKDRGTKGKRALYYKDWL